MKDSIGEIFVVKELSEYESFYDHDWGKEVCEIAKDSPEILELLYNLIILWKSTSRASSLPRLSMIMIEAIANRLEKLEFSNSLTVTLIERLNAVFDRETVLDSKQKEEIQRVLFQVVDKLNEEVGDKRLDFSKENFWDEIVNSKEPLEGVHEFLFSLWGSQRVTFTAIYHAYEDFLVQVYRVVTGKEDFRLGNARGFNKPFKTVFGDSVKEKCWTGDRIELARLVRNSLAHCGGRETEQLKKIKHNLRLVNGVIQITPTMNKELFHTLKDSVGMLVRCAVSLESN